MKILRSFNVNSNINGFVKGGRSWPVTRQNCSIVFTITLLFVSNQISINSPMPCHRVISLVCCLYISCRHEHLRKDWLNRNQNNVGRHIDQRTVVSMWFHPRRLLSFVQFTPINVRNIHIHVHAYSIAYCCRLFYIGEDFINLFSVCLILFSHLSK